jgi:hypothetical protein
MAQPTVEQVAHEMRQSQFADFCTNESVRVARFAARLYEVGQPVRGRALREIADCLGRLATAAEQGAAA